MPFKDDMKEVYWGAIKLACEKAGFAALRVDELKGAFNINRKIIEHIFSSAAIVADLTDWNPNVFYEMGVAHAIDNKTITMQAREETLRAVRAESAAVQKQLREKDASLEQALKKAATLQNELAQKQAEHAALQKQIQISRQPMAPKSVPTSPQKLLRARPLAELADDEVQKMINAKGFFYSRFNKQGKGLQHQYEKGERESQPLVIDHATGLTWQQSGSPTSMNYADAEKYVRELNAKRFAGFDDWRLPTLEEAMSLMEPEKKNGDLYIDPVFDRKQTWIWTADKAKSAGVAWVANFYNGGCDANAVAYNNVYVRAVRVGQSGSFGHLNHLIIENVG